MPMGVCAEYRRLPALCFWARGHAGGGATGGASSGGGGGGSFHSGNLSAAIEGGNILLIEGLVVLEPPCSEGRTTNEAGDCVDVNACTLFPW